jgi:hypothetical protein
VKTTHDDRSSSDQKFGAGQDVFDALQRRLDRIDPSYQS